MLLLSGHLTEVCQTPVAVSTPKFYLNPRLTRSLAPRRCWQPILRLAVVAFTGAFEQEAIDLDCSAVDENRAVVQKSDLVLNDGWCDILRSFIDFLPAIPILNRELRKFF